jgi:hypothetical protein
MAMLAEMSAFGVAPVMVMSAGMSAFGVASVMAMSAGMSAFGVASVMAGMSHQAMLSFGVAPVMPMNVSPPQVYRHPHGYSTLETNLGHTDTVHPTLGRYHNT